MSTGFGGSRPVYSQTNISSLANVATTPPAVGQVLGYNGNLWAPVTLASGSGDVVGPAGATANGVTRYSTTSGKLVKDSSVTISDTADIAGAKTLAMSGSTSGVLTVKPAAITTSHTLTMPPAQGAASTYLKNDGSGALSWTSPGDATGPSSSTDNAIARFDLTTGKLLQNSAVTVSDTADIAGAKTLAMSGATSGVLTVQPAASTTSHTLTFPAAQASGVLTNNGSGALSWAAAAGGGSLLGVQKFTTAGSATYTKTTGTNYALAIITAGGGGGAGSALAAVGNSMGAGGNAGNTMLVLMDMRTFTAAALTIGAGGAGGVGAVAGSLGGSSSYAVGIHTVTASGGNGGANSTNTVSPYVTVASASSNPPSSSVNPIGGLVLQVMLLVGGQGTHAAALSSSVAWSGAGGQSYWTSGGTYSFATASGTNFAGASGQYGSGGAGSFVQFNGASRTGGNGGDGIIVIYEYA